MADHDNNQSSFDYRTIIVIGVLGTIISLIAFMSIWSDGVITNSFDGRRFLALFFAILTGGFVGWMVYPRNPFKSLFEPGGPKRAMEKARDAAKKTGGNLKEGASKMRAEASQLKMPKASDLKIPGRNSNS